MRLSDHREVLPRIREELAEFRAGLRKVRERSEPEFDGEPGDHAPSLVGEMADERVRPLLLPYLAVEIVKQDTHCNRVTFDVHFFPGIRVRSQEVRIPIQVVDYVSLDPKIIADVVVYISGKGGIVRRRLEWPPDGKLSRVLYLQEDPETLIPATRANSDAVHLAECSG